MPNTYRKVYPGVRSGGFQVVTAEGELNLVVNAYYDESTGNWYRIDESKYCWRVQITAEGYIRFYSALSGTGAIIWNQIGILYDTGTFGGIRIQRIYAYSQTTEPDIGNGQVALWEDTSTGKYWFIWDKDGTQRKVELT